MFDICGLLDFLFMMNDEADQLYESDLEKKHAICNLINNSLIKLNVVNCRVK